MGKTIKGKDKAKAKKEAVAKKIARKCKKCVPLIGVLALVLCGCSTTGPQPARSQTQVNNYRDCRITINVTGTATNEVPALEMWTNTQSNEGSESNAPTATPTNTTSPTTTLSYGGKAAAAQGLLEQLLALLKSDGSSSSAASSDSAGSACADGVCTPQ